MATYYWVCADMRRWYAGKRCKSLRTARRYAYHHLIAVGKGRKGGYSEIAKQSMDGITYEGSVHSLGNKKIGWISKFDEKKRKLVKRYVNSDGTLGDLLPE